MSGMTTTGLDQRACTNYIPYIYMQARPTVNGVFKISSTERSTITK